MKPQHAYTLIEIIITLLIIAILSAFAYPSLNHFLKKSQDEILLNQLRHAISYAKFQAQNKNIPVTLCKSNNQISCGGEWSDGYIIFTDENADGIIKNKNQIIFMTQTNNKHGKIVMRTFPYYRKDLHFMPGGLARSSNGTFWHCHEGLVIWALVINKQGRTRVISPDAQGEIKDDHGEVLSCA